MASYLTSLPLFEEFARAVYSQCFYTLLQLRYLPIPLIRIKGIKIGDHEIKIVNFSDNTIICLNSVHVILKLHEDAYSSNINFSKANTYGIELIKKVLNKKEKQKEWSQFSIKILGVNFGNSILHNIIIETE